MKKLEYDGKFMICDKTHSLNYLRSFSERSIRVLNKLETEMEINLQDVTLNSNEFLFSKIRCIFASYQIMLIQFNEICQGLQIPQLGVFVFKIFLQLMSILQSFINIYLKIQSNKESQAKKLIYYSRKQIQQNQQKQKKSLYLDFIDKINGKREYYIHKQRKKYELKILQQEVNKFEINFQQKNPIKQIQDDRSKIKKSIQKALNLQSSNAEFILHEAYIQLNSKFGNFLNYVQMKSNNKKFTQDAPQLKKFCQSITINQNPDKQKCQQILNKLIKIVQKYLMSKQKLRKQNMKDAGAQTCEQAKENLIQSKVVQKRIKQIQNKHVQNIRRIKSQMLEEVAKKKFVQKLLKQKQELFQTQLRKQKLNILKLQKRISNISKLSKQSMMTIDFVNSQKSLMKDQMSVSQFSNVQNIQQRYRNRPSIMSRKMSKNQRSFQSSIGSIRDRKSIFCQKPKNKQLSLNQNIFQFCLRPTKISKIPQIVQIQTIQTLKIDCCVQTESFKFHNEHAKNKPKVQKVVKFKDYFSISVMYSLILSGIQRKATKRIFQIQKEQKHNKNNLLLQRKRKKNIKWPQNKRFRNSNLIQLQVNSLQKDCKNEKNFGLDDFQLIGQQILRNNRLKKYKIPRQNQNFDKKLITSKIPSHDQIIFGSTDIQSLFGNQLKAQNYELLNYNANLHMKWDNYQLLKNRKLSFLQIKNDSKSKQCNQSTGIQKNTRAKSSHLSRNSEAIQKQKDIFMQAFYNHLNTIKVSNFEKYQKIRNFLRFPLSSITKCNEQSWKFLSKQEQEISYGQLRKLFGRLSKIHSQCKKSNNHYNICPHIQQLLKKIGIIIQTRQK